MTILDKWIPALKDLVHEIANGNFVKLEADGRLGRLTVDEIRRVISAYGRTLIELPAEGYEVAQAYPLEDQKDCWAVDLDLWTLEEGHSDLTLSVVVQHANDSIILRIQDLHVL